MRNVTENLFHSEDELIAIDEAADILRVSAATLRNWAKLNLVKYSKQNNKKLVFNKNEIINLKNDIAIGSSNKLQARANKQYTTKKRKHDELNSTHVNKLLYKIDEMCKTNSSDAMLIAIAERLNNDYKNQNKNHNFSRIQNEISEWIENTNCSKVQIENIVSELTALPSEIDLLGKVYQHISNSSIKAISGAFYTPKEIAYEMVKSNLKPNDVCIDPCCGSGIFLLEILNVKNVENEKFPLSKIYGIDTDEVAVKICRINLLLETTEEYKEELHIYNADCIEKLIGNNLKVPNKFDFIATNPPWGANLRSCAYKEKYGENLTDSFSIILALCIDKLNENGKLSFLLPESILDVATHAFIRTKILKETSDIKISHLGKAFKGLLTNVVNIELCKKKPSEETKLLMQKSNRTSNINQLSILNKKNQNLIFDVSDTTSDLLNKLLQTPHYLLKGSSKYALGIVTGNNALHIKTVKDEGLEVVVKGKDINRYTISEVETYIHFNKKSFQQCADESYFRVKEKLIYRFIADKLIIAYDDKKRLTLNSANILIPNLEIPTKVVLAILLCKVTSFIFKSKFNTLKILKHQLQELPIFKFNNTINKKLEALVTLIIESNDKSNQVKYEKEIDEIIYAQLSLTDDERNEIERLLS